MAKTKIKLDFLGFDKIMNVGVFYPNRINEAKRCMIALNDHHKNVDKHDILTSFYYLDRSSKNKLSITVDYTGNTDEDQLHYEQLVLSAYPDDDTYDEDKRRLGS